MLKIKLPQTIVHELIQEAVTVEKQFICDSLPGINVIYYVFFNHLYSLVDLIGMNSSLMKDYIEFVADRLVDALGYEQIWNTKNPFEWMEGISLQGKTNFFERRVGEYQKVHLTLRVFSYLRFYRQASWRNQVNRAHNLVWMWSSKSKSNYLGDSCLS